jgi:hypothetical protein
MSNELRVLGGALRGIPQQPPEPSAEEYELMAAEAELEAAELEAQEAEALAHLATMKVGAGETFLNRFANAIPLGGRAVDGLAAGFASKAYRPLLRSGVLDYVPRFLGGQDDPVQLTPQARALIEEQGTPAMKERLAEAGGELPDEPQGFLEHYRDIRDRRQVRTAVGSEQHPTAAKLGTGAGVLATVLAPGLPAFKAGRGAKLVPRLAAAAGTGAAYGTLGALTEGKADLATELIAATDDDPNTIPRFDEYGLRASKDVGGVDEAGDAIEAAKDGRVTDAALSLLSAGLPGGAFGGLTLGGAAEGANRLPGLVRTLNARAAQKARNVHLDGADQQSRNLKVSDESMLESIDSGAVPPFTTTDKVFDRLVSLNKEQGQVLRGLVESLKAQGVRGSDARQIAIAWVKDAAESFKNSGANKDVAELFLREAANIEAVAPGKAKGGAPMKLDSRATTVTRALHESLVGHLKRYGFPDEDALTVAGSLMRGRRLTGDERYLDLVQQENVKSAQQDQAYYQRFNIDETPKNEAQKRIASTTRQGSEDAVAYAAERARRQMEGERFRDSRGRLEKNYPDPQLVYELSQQFVPAKQRSHRLLEAVEAAQRGTARSSQKTGSGMPNPVDLAEAASKGKIGSVLKKGVRTLLKNRLPAADAYYSRALARALAEGGASQQMSRAEHWAELFGGSLLELGEDEPKALVDELRRRQ